MTAVPSAPAPGPARRRSRRPPFAWFPRAKTGAPAAGAAPVPDRTAPVRHPRFLRAAVGVLLGFGTAAALLAAGSAAAAPPPPRRVAVVVGANQAPTGRTTLRYAHADARGVASALVDVAGFARRDVHVLLDPAPEAVLERLDASLALLDGAEEALLFFYFSGHSDTRALFPGGRPLPLRELKRRLEDGRASVRVGVVDACSGGAWTGAKGLHAAEPFVVDVPFTLGAEGSALVAASSGSENAHEYERIGGSFFTHHFVAGLRGAAERDGDGVVTLGEAFDFAKAGTLRDSAIHAPSPQHPSFVMNLRGRSDLPLARLSGATTRIDVVQEEGPLEVIRLDQALVVLEIPPGQRTTTLALPPGKYVVRRRTRGETFAAEVQLVSGQPVELREESLILVGSQELRSKGTGTPAMLATTLPAGTWEVGVEVGQVLPRLAVDAKPIPFLPRLAVGLGDRWQLSFLLPQVAYRLGSEDGTELALALGIMGVRFGAGDSPAVLPGMSVTARHYLPAGSELLGSVGMDVAVGATGEGLARAGEWRFHGALGWGRTFGGRLTIRPSVSVAGSRAPGLDDSDYAAVFSLGSAPGIAGRSFPLLSWHLSPDWSLDGGGSLTFDTSADIWALLYSAGLTWTF